MSYEKLIFETGYFPFDFRAFLRDFGKNFPHREEKSSNKQSNKFSVSKILLKSNFASVEKIEPFASAFVVSLLKVNREPESTPGFYL